MDAADSDIPAAAALFASLTDSELLARLIGGDGADGLARGLLRRAGGLGRVLAVSDARQTAELGTDRALQLRLARELGVRAARARVLGQPFRPGADLIGYLRLLMAFEPREAFRVAYLGADGTWLADEVLGRGTVDHAPVYPREVIARALERAAAALVLIHNHPSGDPTPSAADIDMTRQVADAAAVLGLRVEDHLVVGADGIASFRALGLL